MISYCVAAFRPKYAKLLIEDLVRKTTVPFEILVWLNVEDPEYEAFLREQQGQGVPLRIVGKTPENIGMQAYPVLFEQARHDLIVQIDDDVVAISRNIAEQAYEIFGKFPRIRQLVADVWQDEYTTGARPPLEAYRLYHHDYGLYDGPIDGWFSVFQRSALPLIPRNRVATYLPLGGQLQNRLRANGYLGVLCARFRVFHVVGPQYASYFDMLDFEIEKYRRLGRHDLADWYEAARPTLPGKEELTSRVNNILLALDQPLTDGSGQAIAPHLEDQEVVSKLKAIFAPDGGAEREHNARAGSCGFGLIHYSLITNLRPNRVLVIGSRYGYVPSIIALALKANGSGVLDFVDASYSDAAHGPNTAFGGVGHWSGDPGGRFSHLGLADVVNVHVQRSDEFFSQCNVRYGYIYIDGDHSYEGCRDDFERSLKVAEAGVLIVLHDVVVTQPGFGVHRMFGALDENLYNKILIPAWPGLGIIQRKGRA